MKNDRMDRQKILTLIQAQVTRLLRQAQEDGHRLVAQATDENREIIVASQERTIHKYEGYLKQLKQLLGREPEKSGVIKPESLVQLEIHGSPGGVDHEWWWIVGTMSGMAASVFKLEDVCFRICSWIDAPGDLIGKRVGDLLQVTGDDRGNRSVQYRILAVL